MEVAETVLVLGGTNFVGRHLTDRFVERGWEVTLFNRGKTNPQLYPELAHIRGNRKLHEAPGLDNLRKAVDAGRTWDVVVDVNGYEPEHVRATARLLESACDRYVYVSSGAVYQVPFPTGGDESTAVRDDPVRDDEYGALKFLCEEEVRKIYGDRSLTLRLGLQCGPHDDTDRINYWVERIRRGGRVLVPAEPDWSFSTVDTRDVAAFAEMASRTGLAGTLNTTGRVITWQEWVETCREAAGSKCEFVWIGDWDFLQDHLPKDQRPYGAYPMRMPPSWGDWWSCSSRRAEQLGLDYRPLTETISDIAEWVDTRPADHKWMSGLEDDQERRIIEAWEGSR